MRERSGIMLCYPLSLSRVEKMKSLIVQPKLNGVRARAIKLPSGISVVSSTCREFVGLDYIKREAEVYLANEPNGSFLDGELYVHGLDFETIESITSRTVNAPEGKVEFHVFDLVTPANLPLLGRIKLIEGNKDLYEYIRRVSSIKVQVDAFVKDALSAFAKVWQKAGYEGIVVKNANSFYIPKRSPAWMKYKPYHEDEYTVLGVYEEYTQYGEPKGRLGGISVYDSDNRTFCVGSGLTEEQRTELWKDRGKALVGKKIKVKYFGLTLRGIPRHPVFVSVV